MLIGGKSDQPGSEPRSREKRGSGATTWWQAGLNGLKRRCVGCDCPLGCLAASELASLCSLCVPNDKSEMAFEAKRVID